MVDVDGTGNIYLDKKQDGEGAMLEYLFSTFTCLPGSCNDTGNLPLRKSMLLAKGEGLVY